MCMCMSLGAFFVTCRVARHLLQHGVFTEPAWEQVFGHPFRAYLDASPAISASFDATMAVDAGNAGGGGRPLRCNQRRHGTLAGLPETAARGPPAWTPACSCSY
jgi:hypothetical protein